MTQDKQQALYEACNLAINPDNVAEPDTGARCIAVSFSGVSNSNDSGMQCIDVSFKFKMDDECGFTNDGDN